VICIARTAGIALRDYLTRQFDSSAQEPSVSDAALVVCLIGIASQGKAIIERSAVFITNEESKYDSLSDCLPLVAGSQEGSRDAVR